METDELARVTWYVFLLLFIVRCHYISARKEFSLNSAEYQQSSCPKELSFYKQVSKRQIITPGIADRIHYFRNKRVSMANSNQGKSWNVIL